MYISWRVRRRLAAAVLVVASTGCSSLHSTYVPDGRRGFAITCGGVLNSASSCLVKAGERAAVRAMTRSREMKKIGEC
jgi:hypothetical protein